MKESDGVYQFGTKRVCVRVDKGKISIRVGGGYLGIDEFLDIYTPQELEKLERNDPVKKFSEIHLDLICKRIRFLLLAQRYGTRCQKASSRLLKKLKKHAKEYL